MADNEHENRFAGTWITLIQLCHLPRGEENPPSTANGGTGPFHLPCTSSSASLVVLPWTNGRGRCSMILVCCRSVWLLGRISTRPAAVPTSGRHIVRTSSDSQSVPNLCRTGAQDDLHQQEGDDKRHTDGERIDMTCSRL